MELFRRLTGNLFFKIILGLVALSFVFFGVSGFILGNPNSWVAKIGNSQISLQKFNKALKSDRELVLATTKSEEAMKFLESAQFKSTVLNRLVSRVMTEKLQDDLGVEASRRLILQSIARDPNFKDADGKFDRNKFRRFLSQNGFNEEKYVNEIASNIVGAIVIQTLSMSAPVNHQNLLEKLKFQNEKRFADVVVIASKNIKNLKNPTKSEIKEFYEANKGNYILPEYRKVSYIRFSKSDFAKDFKVTNKEVREKYDENKDSYKTQETRNFYHLVFDDKKEAEDFAKKIKKSKNQKAEFKKLAKSLKKKKLSEISLDKISRRDLLPELIGDIFKLKINGLSKVLKSSLGFHVFLLNKVNEPEVISFAKAKSTLKKQIAKDKKDLVLQEKITQIDDYLLTSNSLKDTAKKFSLKYPRSVVIDINGQDKKQRKNKVAKSLKDFAQNAFASQKGQVSKIFLAQNSKGFYALKVEKIEKSREKSLREVRTKITKDLKAKNKAAALRKLANKISSQIAKNPSKAMSIAAKYRLETKRNKSFPRSFFYKGSDGQKTAYKNKFLTDLFAIEKGQATSLVPSGEGQFTIGVLRKIQKAKLSNLDIEKERAKAAEDFKSELLQEYNRVLIEKNPIQINEKLFGQLAGN